MDTKTPPIPLKLQEKPQPRKQERVADVSLPPLTSSKNHRQKQKLSGTPWSRDAPCAIRYQDQKKRPYRVLHIGATPLMHACQQADRARVLRLLKEQEDTVGYRDRTLRNTLHYCMDAGTGGAVAAAAPELVNAPDAEGHTPLHLAVIAGDTQLVAVLLANGADVNAKDLEGHSVLHWATVCGEAECVRLVLAAGARPSTPDLRGGSPLHYAAQCCGAAATAELAVPKKVGLKVLQTLLEFGADVNAKDEDGRQPILWAASAGSVEAILALARAGGSAAAGASDKDGLTALHCAASRGHARCIEALVNLCGSHLDHVDDNGCSALHYAATLGHADATALILKLGADPNRQDRKGRTPALCAAAKGQLETLKILAQHGGSLHARTVRGTGVAHEAVASGRIELIKWLAKKRPSTLDVATHDGKTPLHVAALHGHLDVCKVLLDNGARINAVLRTSKGNLMTPLDAALYRGHRDCAKLIQMHGGTMAQQLTSQKTSPNKVFATKLRVRRAESSTDTETSPHRRGRSHRLPELYYEERWIERRTRRRGSLRKLARRDSRSFSEEEVRLSKTSSKRDHQRRARSESARYDDDDSIERKLRRRKCKRRSAKHRHDYSESSVDSDSYERTEDTVKERPVTGKGGKKAGKGEDKQRSIGAEDKEDSQKENEDGGGSVSDDSLEVVVVKKSLEKKCEKVVSGRRSKTPRESSKQTKLTKMRRSTRRKSKSRCRAPEDEEVLKQEQSPEQSKGYADATTREEKMASVEEDRDFQERIIENRYRKDVTDSTSQETVERVVVTALVHKDQDAETPKSESAKEVTFEDNVKEGMREMEEKDAVQSILKNKVQDVEKAAEERSSHLEKAVDLKKDMEDVEEEIVRESVQSKAKDAAQNEAEEDKILYADDEERAEGKLQEGTKEGRLDVPEAPESENLQFHSQAKHERLHHQEEDLLIRPQESTSIELDDSEESRKTKIDRRKKTAKEGYSGSEGKSETPTDQESKEKSDASPRTVIEDIPMSDEEGTENLKSEEAKLKAKPRITRRKSSSDDQVSKSSSSERKSKSSSSERKSSDKRKSKSSSDERGLKSSSSRQSDSHESSGSLKGSSGSLRKREIKKRQPSAKKVSIQISEKSNNGKGLEEKKQDVILEQAAQDTQDLQAERLINNKEQAESTRGRSVDFSSESRDSALMEDDKDGSLGNGTPVTAKERTTADANDAPELPAKKTDEESKQKDKGEPENGRKHSVEDVLEEKNLRYIDESSSGSLKSPDRGRSRPSTGRVRRTGRSSSKSPTKRSLFESSEERSPDRSAIVAVIESPEWDEEDEEIDREIRDVMGEDLEHDTEPEEDDEIGVVRVLPSTSEEETPRIQLGATSASDIEPLPQVQTTRTRLTRLQSPSESRHSQLLVKQRRDSGGRDSGIEPSPRVSRIPRRRTMKCCPNSEKQQALNMDTITRDVQISLRRYHLERKIFFQLMELKRLQIRHGRANEHVLVKRQVDSFNKAGMSGPTLGVAKYDQPLTFRHFESFLYEQLRKLQKRPATPDFCTEAKQCTQKTHRCHHATSAYTSVPVYTYLGGGALERADLLPKIESRGKGQMTVEVTHGEEKQIIALPAERLDRTKRYFVTFTVKGECQETEKPKSSIGAHRSAKSV